MTTYSIAFIIKTRKWFLRRNADFLDWGEGTEKPSKCLMRKGEGALHSGSACHNRKEETIPLIISCFLSDWRFLKRWSYRCA